MLEHETLAMFTIPFKIMKTSINKRIIIKKEGYLIIIISRHWVVQL